MVHPIEQYAIDMVKRLRHQHKLRGIDIAKIIKTKHSFISNVENSACPAKYNLKHLNLLAKYFDVSPRIFVPESPIKLLDDPNKLNSTSTV